MSLTRHRGRCVAPMGMPTGAHGASRRDHRHALPHAGVVAGIGLLLASACSAPPEPEGLELGTVRQAATFPATADWIPITQAGQGMADPTTDGANNGRE